ncbi:hypothetical protein pb186bvf_009040 [Paramecium bursaria]
MNQNFFLLNQHKLQLLIANFPMISRIYSKSSSQNQNPFFDYIFKHHSILYEVQVYGEYKLGSPLNGAKISKTISNNFRILIFIQMIFHEI